jgi:hypothetical protein
LNETSLLTLASRHVAENGTRYWLLAVCLAEDEQKMRALLMHTVNASSLKIHSLLSEDTDNHARIEISARMAGTRIDHTAMGSSSRALALRRVSAP